MCIRTPNVNPSDRFQTAAELRDAIDKLKYKCRWQPIDDAVWEGAMYNTISVLVNRTKTKNEFIAKKNGRTISAETKRFNTEDEAIKYMYSFIASNTIN